MPVKVQSSLIRWLSKFAPWSECILSAKMLLRVPQILQISLMLKNAVVMILMKISLIVPMNLLLPKEDQHEDKKNLHGKPLVNLS